MAALPRLAILDCDGTLVDSERLIVAAMQRACADVGLEDPGAGRIREQVGLSLGDAALRLWPAAGPEQLQQAVGAYRAAFGELRATLPAEPLFPGTVELLDALAAEGVLLAVATGKSRRGLRHVLAAHDLAGRFACLKTADDAPGKPHPGMLLQAMDETGSEPHETIMVGDTTFDMEAGVNAGARSIGVAWGYHEAGALRAAGAEAILAGWGALLPHLRGG